MLSEEPILYKYEEEKIFLNGTEQDYKIVWREGLDVFKQCLFAAAFPISFFF